MKKTIKKCTTALGLTVLMAMGTANLAFAKETVNITVENVSGGAIMASYSAGGKEVYLPIGETTAVPEGTQLEVWTSTSGLSQRDGRRERAYLLVNGEDVSAEGGRNTYTFETEEDTLISAGFSVVPRQDGIKASEYALELTFASDFAYQADAGLMNQQLVLYCNDNVVDFSQATVQLTEILCVGEGDREKTYQPSQFTLTPGGLLSSNTALDYGSYDFVFNANYGGVEEELYLSYTVGIAGAYSFPIYETASNGYAWYGITNIATLNLNSGSTVGDLINVCNAKINKTIAGYSIIGWKNAANGAPLTDSTPISSIMQENGYVEICPIFQNPATGNIYQVVIQ